MKRITVKNRRQIKELLYDGYILSIKDNQYRSFGGFQRWTYDRHRDICHHCESHWTDSKKTVEGCSLDKAAKILWHKRNSLFLYTKNIPEDKKSKIAAFLEKTT